MEKSQLRQANGQDLIHMEEIFQLIFEENRKSLMAYKEREELKAEIVNGQAFLLFLDEILVGYCSYKIWQSCIEIMSLVLRAKYRQRGYGFTLCYYVVNLAKELWPDKLILALPNDNSVGILQKCGFVEFPKVELPDELRQSCAGCLEYNDFPDCHCQTLRLPGKIKTMK